MDMLAGYAPALHPKLDLHTIQQRGGVAPVPLVDDSALNDVLDIITNVTILLQKLRFGHSPSYVCRSLLHWCGGSGHQGFKTPSNKILFQTKMFLRPKFFSDQNFF